MPSSPLLIPDTVEKFSGGMNSLLPKQELGSSVWQEIINSYPGIVAEPRNGCNQIKEDDTDLGYGSTTSYYRQKGIHINKGGKSFVFQWHRCVSDTGEYGLEVWNVTDDTRTVLIAGDFDESSVYFKMTKLYDAIYCVMDYEIVTNHNSSYQKKNLVIYWDDDNSQWATRSMGFDVAPVLNGVVAQDSFSTIIPFAPQAVATEFGGKLFTYFEGHSKIYSSNNGYLWESTTCPIVRTSLSLVSYSNALYLIGKPSLGDYIVAYKTTNGEDWTTLDVSDINGVYPTSECNAISFAGKIFIIVAGTDNTTRVYSTETGSSWTLVNGSPSLPAKYSSFGMCVYNNKIYCAGGADSSTQALDEVYSSSDGDTWTQETAAASFSDRSFLRMVNYDGKMWVLFGKGLVGQPDRTEVYSSTDGSTWTEESSDFGIPVRREPACAVFNNQVFAIAGRDYSSNNLNDVNVSSNGYDFSELEVGFTNGKYISLTSTFVRHTNAQTKLSEYDSYNFSEWETYNGKTIAGSDEKVLSGTITAGVFTTIGDEYSIQITGSGTSFTTDLQVNDYISIEYMRYACKVTSITDNTHIDVTCKVAEYNPVLTISSRKYAKLPAIGDPVTITSYITPEVEGIEEFDNRKTIYINASTDYGRIFVPIPEVTNAVAQGATHLRIYMTLEAETLVIAEGLDHRFIADIAITGDSFDSSKIYRINLTNSQVSGSLNTIDVTGFDVAPQGRFSIFAGGVNWIGGNPDNSGYWFHSSLPLDTRYPQKYASMFKTSAANGAYYITCDPSDDQKDTGCVELGGSLFFFKERKIFVLDNANYDNVPRRISDAIGCPFPETITMADVPNLGGQCALFLSNLGPAILFPGGSLQLLYEFPIAELWPDGELFVKSDGSATSWYSRNKVCASFWQGKYIITYGDSVDSECDYSTNKTFVFSFGNDGVSIGASQFVWGEYNDDILFEPQNLIPVDDVVAYCISHRSEDEVDGIKYRLVQFQDKSKYQDTFGASVASYNMQHKTRALYLDNTHKRHWLEIPYVVVFMEFVDSDGLTLSITSDEGRLTATCTHSQTRQSGVAVDDTIRDFIVGIIQSGFFGHFFELTITKTVPSTGAVKFFGCQLAATLRSKEHEFLSQFGNFVDTVTFIKEADAVGGEEDAYS